MEATLSVKGKGSVGSGAIQLTRQAAIFGFSKDLLPIAPRTKKSSSNWKRISIPFAPLRAERNALHGTLAV